MTKVQRLVINFINNIITLVHISIIEWYPTEQGVLLGIYKLLSLSKDYMNDYMKELARRHNEVGYSRTNNQCRQHVNISAYSHFSNKI